MQSIIHECNDDYDTSIQDEEDYGVGWKPTYENASFTNQREEYRYTTANVLDGYPYMGDRVWYSGGGYTVRLRGNATVLRNKLIELEKEGWVDRSFFNEIYINETSIACSYCKYVGNI